MDTIPGHAIPPAPRHSITVHLPGWSRLERWLEGDQKLVSSIQSMYPRLMLHRDVRELSQKIWEKAGSPAGQACLLFSHFNNADQCETFACEATNEKEALMPEEVYLGIFAGGPVLLWAVFFPASRRPCVQPFWTHTGTGISSRLAEASLKHIDAIHELSNAPVGHSMESGQTYHLIQSRIVEQLLRAPIEPRNNVKPSDVYLYSTGMAAIYKLHRSIETFRGGVQCLFSFPFKSTLFIFQNMGTCRNGTADCPFFGRGDQSDLQELETELQARSQADPKRRIKAIWTEIPSNPMLTSADLVRLRQLADKYDALLIVDDTVGSFCNIDVLGVADVVITSLTKSFSGYADVMGASTVLNPSSSKYAELKNMFNHSYSNDYWPADVDVLEANSRDYLRRSAILNSNAEQLVNFIHAQSQDPRSTVTRVYYPTLNPDRKNYERFMRPATPEFTPGYGCLFSIEFDTIASAIAFYDNLAVHSGPHLGAHLSLVFPFVKGIYAKQLDWVKQYGLREQQIRVSVGLEDIEYLKQVFAVALQAADSARVCQ